MPANTAAMKEVQKQWIDRHLYKPQARDSTKLTKRYDEYQRYSNASPHLWQALHIDPVSLDPLKVRRFLGWWERSER